MVENAGRPPAHALMSGIAALNLPALVTLHPIDDTTVEITNLKAEQPRRGAGRKTMQAILGLADELGVVLELWPVIDDIINGLDQDDLEKWYRRLGFKDVPNRDPDSLLTYDHYLVREPVGGR